LDVGQQGALAAVKAKSIVGCITSSTAGTSRAVILSTCYATSRIRHPILGPPIQLWHQQIGTSSGEGHHDD